MPGLARSRDKSKKCEGYRLSFLARQMEEWLSTLGYTRPSGKPDRKNDNYVSDDGRGTK